MALTIEDFNSNFFFKFKNSSVVFSFIKDPVSDETGRIECNNEYYANVKVESKIKISVYTYKGGLYLEGNLHLSDFKKVTPVNPL